MHLGDISCLTDSVRDNTIFSLHFLIHPYQSMLLKCDKFFF